jgi:hypothetical protein
MRRACGWAWGPAIALGLCVGPARADTSVHATGSVSFGYDDNLLGAPDDPPAGILGPIQVWTLQPTPGLALYHDAPRARFLVSYAHSFVFYLNRINDSTSADVGSATGIFALSPVDELILSLGVNRFTTSQTLTSSAQETGVGAQPGGDSTLLNLSLTEGWVRELSQDWRLIQALGAGFTFPIDAPGAQPTIFSANASIGPEVTLGHHGLGVFANGIYTRPFLVGGASAEEQAGFLSEDQAVIGANARWRWDWTLDWGSELGAGLGIPFDAAGDVAVAPTWSALIRFDREGYAASLGYTRAITPNLITGQTYYSDTIALVGGIPLWAEGDIGLMTSSGFSWNRVIDEDQNIDTDIVNTWVADVAVGWFPELYPQVALRYQRIQQFNAPEDQTVLPNFTRNVATLTVSYMFPPRDFVLPKEPARRVDGGDRDPLVPGAAEGPAPKGGAGEKR